jgi:hypothetical protein
VAWPRLGAYRSGGGKARKHDLHSDPVFPGRCQARCGFHASHKGKNGPQLVVGTMESSNTHSFRCLALGNLPTRVEAFPALFCRDVTLPQAVDCLPAFARRNSSYIGEHGSVFTTSPALANPYTIQFSRYSQDILTEEQKSGKTRDARAKARNASPLPLKRRGLRRAEAPLGHMQASFWLY